MPKRYASVEMEFQLGCIIVRDSSALGDTSTWEPGESPFFVDDGAAIFSVPPDIEGPINIEVWRDEPPKTLPIELFATHFLVRGELLVEDPAGLLRIALPALPALRGGRLIRVLVDDPNWSQKVQIVVSDG